MQPATRKRLEIRAHHLLCMFGFRGLGYSRAFVDNMRAIVDSFFSESGAEVGLLTRCDAICAACPHLRHGECAAEEGADLAVRTRDEKVLAMLGLAAGDRLDSPSLARLVADKVQPSDLPVICAGCQWLQAGYCQEGLSNFQRGR